MLALSEMRALTPVEKNRPFRFEADLKRVLQVGRRGGLFRAPKLPAPQHSQKLQVAKELNGVIVDVTMPHRIMLLVSDMRIGGAERVAVELASYWATSGILVELVAAHSKKVESEFAIPSGVHFVRLADVMVNGDGRVANPVDDCADCVR